VSPEVSVASTVQAPVPARLARRVAEGVLRAERAPRGSLALTFVGPRRMRALNRAWFGRDRPTDVIAFRYGGPALGEVFICPEVAGRNARRFAVPPREETLRLVVHGVLHVLGYDHPDGDRRTASPMWRRQERYLRRFARGR
jgi:probable rRNA maturation factor